MATPRRAFERDPRHAFDDSVDYLTLPKVRQGAGLSAVAKAVTVLAPAWRSLRSGLRRRHERTEVPPALTLQVQARVVERLEAAAMADADQDQLRQLATQQRVELVLQPLVE